MWALYALCLVFLLESAAAGAPRWLRLSWSATDETDTSMTVAWTDVDDSGGTVEYRPSGGTVSTVAAAAFDTGSPALETTYEAVLTELLPSTAYDYRVRSGDTWSEWKTFTTPPPVGSCDHIKFIVGGDGRGGEEFYDPGYVSRHWDNIAAYIKDERPDFVVYTGDLVHRGEEDQQWEEWFSVSELLTSEIPMLPVIGNHDDGPGEGDNQWYTRMFALPHSCAGEFDAEVDPDGNGIEEIWAMVVGNVLMVALSTERVDTAVQHAFLETTLTEWESRVDWKIVFFHRPLWSSGLTGNNDGNELDADNLIGIIDDYNVDFVLTGHDHDYERFHPARGGFGGRPRMVVPLPDDGGSSGIADGPIHVVSGGLGSFTNFGMFCRVEGCFVAHGNLNYMVLDIEGKRADVVVRDLGPILTLVDATMRPDPIDQFTVYKAASICDSEPDDDAEQYEAVEPVDIADMAGDDVSVDDGALEPAGDAATEVEDIDVSTDMTIPDEQPQDMPEEEGIEPGGAGGCNCSIP